MSVMVVAGAVVGLLVGVVVGVKVLPWLAREEQGYPGEAEIEPMLIPLLYKAICAAYKASERAVDELGSRMDGADKAAIAEALYPHLPDWARLHMSLPTWCRMVQGTFDQFMEFYDGAADGLDRAFEQWASEWAVGDWNLPGKGDA